MSNSSSNMNLAFERQTHFIGVAISCGLGGWLLHLYNGCRGHQILRRQRDFWSYYTVHNCSATTALHVWSSVLVCGIVFGGLWLPCPPYSYTYAFKCQTDTNLKLNIKLTLGSTPSDLCLVR